MLEIKVVGPGCANCEKLYELCREVLLESKIDGFVDKVTDRNQITELGIWMTPGLIANGKVLSMGKIPTKSTLEHWLREAIINV
jgi:small redox-active disulfide protein 2